MLNELFRCSLNVYPMKTFGLSLFFDFELIIRPETEFINAWWFLWKIRSFTLNTITIATSENANWAVFNFWVKIGSRFQEQFVSLSSGISEPLETPF